ncbi:MAG: outer membrane beta-barrel protein [Rhizobiaceae bacterium]|nr:outer membrane beta-barrel protein [Rhizobiaceae bacterium]
MRKSVLAGILAALVATNSNALAADAIVASDPAPAPESFDESRFYVSGFIGAAFVDDNEFENVVSGTGLVVDLDYDTGVFLGGAIGKQLGDFGPGSLRGELEVSYFNSDIDRLDFTGNAASPDAIIGDAEFSSVNLAANFLLDFDAGGVFTPYVGAGLGIAFTDIEAVYVPGPRLDDSDTNFLLQGIIGASAPLNDNADVFVEGRYQRIFDVESQRILPNGVVTGTGEADFDTFTVAAGLRYRLN